MTQVNSFFDVKNNPFLNPENNPFMDPKNNPFIGGDLKTMLSSYQIPGLDIEGLLATQRRNLEAITEANKTAAEGIRSVFTRQAEILKSLMEEANTAIQELGQSGAPEDQIAKQVDLTKNKLEAAVSNIRELSELTAKSQSEAFDILNTRFAESLEEVKSLTKTTKAKAKTASAKS